MKKWIVSPDDPVIVQTDPDDSFVAMTLPCDAGVATQLDYDRARLIAAAPDLLAALEALTECNLDHPGGSCDHYERARAAIAKARGQ